MAIHTVPEHVAGPTASDDVLHIPGEDGLPFFGVAYEFLTNPRGLSRRMSAQYGRAYRIRFLGQRTVSLAGADALQLVLLDRERNFSSQLGWDHSIGRLFSRGLMLLDFDEHRSHRRLMQVAFRKSALAHYLGTMHTVARDAMRDWGGQASFRFYPAIKQLTLDTAAVAFLGIELDARAREINRAFIDAVAASLALIRVPVPGLKLARGLKARRELATFFASQIPARRAGDGQDMFSHLCRATDEDGNRYSDADIINHMIFLMMAAHDTVTSSLTTAAYGLARFPEWQEQLRAEAAPFGDAPLAYDDLDALSHSDNVFNEALRSGDRSRTFPVAPCERSISRARAFPPMCRSPCRPTAHTMTSGTGATRNGSTRTASLRNVLNTNDTRLRSHRTVAARTSASACTSHRSWPRSCCANS